MATLSKNARKLIAGAIHRGRMTGDQSVADNIFQDLYKLTDDTDPNSVIPCDTMWRQDYGLRDQIDRSSIDVSTVLPTAQDIIDWHKSRESDTVMMMVETVGEVEGITKALKILYPVKEDGNGTKE
jgi:hypothetical protein